MQNFYNEIDTELKKILNFWMDKTIDNKCGGFIGQINTNNIPVPTADKGAVLNSRILWTFSAAYRHEAKPEYLQTAERAYEYLIEHFWDKENGGIFWSVDYLGQAENKRKQTYVQGFGIYGLAEFYLASGNKEALSYSQKLYSLLEEHCYDSVNGGYIEALSTDWLPLEDMRLSSKDANEPKSMNTHLHILEPYTTLYRAWPNSNLKLSIQKLTDVFFDKIIDTESGHFNLFFGMNWESKAKTISFGHDIEGAWLLREAAEVINDKPLLTKVEEAAIRLVDITLSEGTDSDGSVFYEENQGHVDKDKHWWVQAEAMVGLIDAFQISKNPEYLNEMLRVWEFIKVNIIDAQNGEWFWSVDAKGKPSIKEDKVGFWKCPYHNSRALIEIQQRLVKCGFTEREKVQAI